MQKLLSIVTVTYNAEKYLHNCVESVQMLKEKYGSLIEYIIVDGKSTDETISIIGNYYSLGVVDFYISESNNGIFDAMNKGIEYCGGEYVLIIGSDDFLLPQNFVDIIKCLSTEHPNICYGNVLFIGRTDDRIIRIYKAGSYKKWKTRLGWHPPHSGTIVRKSLLEQNKFNEKYKISTDVEMEWGTLSNSSIITYKDVFLSFCRIGGASTRKVKEILKANREVYEIAKLLGYKFPILTIVMKLLWKLTQVIRAKFANKKKFMAQIEYMHKERSC